MNHRSPSRTTRSTPSPPMPARRSHRARTRSAICSSDRSPWTLPSWSGSSTKSFSVPCPLRNVYSGIHALLVVLGLVVLVELLERHLAGLDVLRDDGAPRDGAVRVPGLRLPEPRPQERLRAVEEDLLDLDDDREDRPVALDHHLVEERRVHHEPGAAIDAQG